jgi:excinuclease UvrABC ATPase subunit
MGRFLSVMTWWQSIRARSRVPAAATPPPTPACWDPIRKAFAKANGVKPALFSSNSEGACPACNGAGVIYTDLGIMATVSTICEACEGKRFNAAVLEYKLAGMNIAQVLAMSVTAAGSISARARPERPPRGPSWIGWSTSDLATSPSANP